MSEYISLSKDSAVIVGIDAGNNIYLTYSDLNIDGPDIDIYLTKDQAGKIASALNFTIKEKSDA